MKITNTVSSLLAIVIASPSMASVDMDHKRKLSIQKIKSERFHDLMTSGNGTVTQAVPVASRSVKHQHNPETFQRIQESLDLQRTKGDGQRFLRRPNQQRHLNSSFSSFCSTVESIYESAGFDCVCDAEDEYVACAAIFEDLYSTVILAYDGATQAYDFGLDCLCSTAACDISPTTCLLVSMQPSMACAEMDIAAGMEETMCHDCRICSTSSGLVELEADECYGDDYGCFQTFLLAPLSGGGGPSPTPPPAPAPTQPPAPDSDWCVPRGEICYSWPDYCCSGLSCTDTSHLASLGVTLCE